MEIQPTDGLLFVSMTVTFQGKSKTIDHLVLDTGASHSVISMDLVDDIGIYGDIDDEIVIMHGIGGVERSIRKKIESVEFGTFMLPEVKLDFANFDAHFGINGLLGADILTTGRFVIDLDAMELYQK